ncbi:MBL fold metallo-hydrolase [Persicimonas caeni]|uniref:Hydroxyacylglutathione hydrolase n=2 Tax=Persicimonas caeni TaxID=2292766 RepID=A0A4Y6PN17_PERCE|nr:MBL fold metallo-hydrolase [Persicimonas caeni]QED30913.1 MBL fold metallo-hydrolase [Persicimonas caeni]
MPDNVNKTERRGLPMQSSQSQPNQMQVDIIASEVSDNFFYVVHDAAGKAALIDPIDGAQAVAHISEHGLDLELVVNTHFHHDHIGGNDTVFERFPNARLVAGAGDSERIEAQQSRSIDRRLADGDSVEVGEASLTVLDTPGHTPGHISLLGGEHLFCGDTIFVAGAGNCKFGGDPSVLYRTFASVLSELDDEVVFYPGHDYSVRDLEFALSLEPDNERAEELLEEARAKNEAGEIFLTTLGTERRYSPFFRYSDPELVRALEDEHADVFEEEREESETRDEAVFRTVRELRNRW